MSRTLRVAISGFTAFERATFEAIFRLSARRTPCYEQCDTLKNAHFVIADGQSAAALEAVDAAGKQGRTLLIGPEAEARIAAHMPRPINLMTMIDVLDRMAEDLTLRRQRMAGAGQRPAESESSQSELVLQSLFSFTHGRARPPATRVRRGTDSGEITLVAVPSASPLAPVADLRAHGSVSPAEDSSEPAPEQPSTQNEPQTPAHPMEDILVVDDSDLALRFMASRLARFGFDVHLSRSGDDALQRSGLQRFSYVFMDADMPGLDGFDACEAIKRSHRSAGRSPPVVLMLVKRGTPVDRLRGERAGCDGYLAKPLDEAELLLIIGDRMVEQHEFARTSPVERFE